MERGHTLSADLKDVRGEPCGYLGGEYSRQRAKCKGPGVSSRQAFSRERKEVPMQI